MRWIAVALLGLAGCSRTGGPDPEGDDNTAGGTTAPGPGEGSGDVASSGATLSLGFQHGCAIDGARVRCWGSNTHGQLGDGSTIDRSAAVTVAGIVDAVEVAAGGNISCVRARDGRVRCWGDGHFGQLGPDGPMGISATPIEITGLRARSVSVGAAHACAVTNEAKVVCWGTLGEGDELGLASVPCERAGTCDSTVRPVPSLSGIVAVAAGYYSTCALAIDGAVSCWGRNKFGQLGDGTFADRAIPVPIDGLRARAVGVGAVHACALVTDGGVRCFGDNRLGRLGSSASPGERCDSRTAAERSATPRTVEGLRDALALAVGAHHACARRATGQVVCWGRSWDGELGAASPDRDWCSFAPVVVSDLREVSELAVGASFACAVTAAGARRCWGRNLFGQLGDGTTADRRTPVDMKW